ncbi:MAG: DNA repair protein RecO [Fimbriimonadaceae bacterium]|nr:DNA repair protein RecO [Fimbriimonadaceae bacterium]QYK55260.1 MAG: DNA repair protein RecO [Fimbriimonadaceae bacterium]
MSREVSDEAIVLRRHDAGESDRRLVLLTRTFGKLDVVAKGARKSGSRLAGSSELLARSLVTWAPGPARRFVTHVRPVTSYPGLRTDYDRLMAGLAVAEVVATALPYESPAPDTFDLMGGALAAIAGGEPWEAPLVWFLAWLLREEGLGTDWTRCVVTGEGLDLNPAWVSASAGGFVRAESAEPYADRRLVSAEALIALKKVSGQVEPPPRIARAAECLGVLLWFWSATLERELPTLRSLLRTREAPKAKSPEPRNTPGT